MSSPPYHPGYGVDPPLLAGRDELIDGALGALGAGPRHPSFGQGFVGDRGVGKTALLNEIERRTAAELGWPVVVLQAVPGEDLLPGLITRLIDAIGSGWQRAGRLVRELETELELTANLLVVRASGRVRSGGGRAASPTVALEGLLRRAGEFAKARDSGVLITIDEAHAMRRPELAVLAAALQIVTKRTGLPIAVVFAGLPEFRQASHRAGTFFERMPVVNVGYLSAESTRFALVKPAADIGVAFDDDALELLVGESNGYPYLVQLLGFETWMAAAGASRITPAHATVGVRVALEKMESLFQSRWDELSDLERDYVHAVATRGPGPVAVADVQVALGRSSRQLATTRAKLIAEHHILVPVRYGELRLALPRFGEWVSRQDRSTRPTKGKLRVGSRRPST